MKYILTFLVGILIGTATVGTYWYYHPEVHTVSVNIASDIKQCEDWGGEFKIGYPGHNDDYTWLGGGAVYPPYKLIDKDWAEKCTKFHKDDRSTTTSLY